MREYAAYWRMRREATTKRPLMPAIGLGGTVALLAATLPSLLGGKGASTRSQRVAFIDHSSLSPKRAPRRPRPVAPPPSKRLVVRTPAHPTLVATRVVAPAPQPVVTPPKADPRPAPATTTPPAQSPVHATNHPVASDGHPSAKPAARASHPAVAAASHPAVAAASHPTVTAAVARTAPPVTHVASDVQKPQGSGGAAPQAPQRPRNRPRPSTNANTSTHAHTHTNTSTTTHPQTSHRSAVSGGAAIRGSHRATGTGSAPGYVNPFAHASVTPERIDQGVDYGGSGPLGALGAGKITYVGTSGTGWPGAFIEFRLSSGPDAGRYVYYAESIVPAQGLHVGERISAGQVIATMTGGIEVGWGAGIGTESYAMQQGQWSSGMDSGNVATPAGKNFSALIASLGGPPGKVEG